eukprot:TRINITY_DN13107_c0_g3_i1.p1 TRINITY_DN13107_c0_g3~~TRINITY_DN13107_c0_g3_i1.p1  ORF type:complete len:458 (-),score=124.41 TRINITY_DN13107_c0_g3_i1:168-1541(-)
MPTSDDAVVASGGGRGGCGGWPFGDVEDPVFEGMVREFELFDEALQAIVAEIEKFLSGVEELSGSTYNLADSLFRDLSASPCQSVASGALAFREASVRIARPDAPLSALAKIRRNVAYNLTKPLRAHVENNEKLRKDLEKRDRRLEELREAKAQLDECEQNGLQEGSTDQRRAMADAEFALSRRRFREEDQRLFEWLYSLEQHKGDILDTAVQTVKHIQYDYFAMSAHAIASTLPRRMEFRPMAEMNPDCLKAQVDAQLKEAEEDEGEEAAAIGECRDSSAFAARMVLRSAALDGEATSASAVQVPVDPMSLSSLLAQGFEESSARKALRLHGNDTQAALDWLVEGGEREELLRGGGNVATTATAAVPPARVTRVQRLEALRRSRQEADALALRRREDAEAAPELMGVGAAERPGAERLLAAAAEASTSTAAEAPAAPEARSAPAAPAPMGADLLLA